MGLFGIKKVDEKNNRSNTFFNDSVINAPDYSNMPNNNVVGYMQPMDSVQNVNRENTSYNGNNINTQETFVFSQVNKNDYNNQFVNTNFNQVQNYSNNNVTQNDYNNMVSNDVFMQAPTSNNNMMNHDVVMRIPDNNNNNNNQVNLNRDNYHENFESNIPYNQNNNDITSNSFDNSALFSLPNGAIADEPVVEVLDELEDPPPVLEPQDVLDPLNNGSNPIPVNPVATKEEPKVEAVEEIQEEQPLFEEEEEIKTNLFTVISMMFNVVINPGTTISTNARRYKKIFDSLMVTFWITMLSIILSLAGRIIAGCFSTSYNAISGASRIGLNFSNLVDANNYVPYLLITFLIGIVAALVIGLVYYISSFISSKGIHIGTYLAISTLSIVPVIVGFTIIHPIVSIITSTLASMLLIFCIIYSLMILITGMNEILKFKNKNSRIIYNAINITIIISIIIFIFETLSRMNVLDLMILL